MQGILGADLPRASPLFRDLVIVPAHDKRRRKRFQQALAACNEQFGAALERLLNQRQGSKPVARHVLAANTAGVWQSFLVPLGRWVEERSRQADPT